MFFCHLKPYTVLLHILVKGRRQLAFALKKLAGMVGMSIRMRMAFIILTGLFMYFLVIAFSHHIIFKPQFVDFTEQMAISQIKKGIDLMLKEEQSLIMVARDYARWDRTYEYAVRRDEDYIKENFTKGTLDNLGLSLVAIFDKKGNLLYGIVRGRDKWARLDDAQFLQLVKEKSQEKSWAGFFIVRNELLFIAGEAILRSDGTGEPRGLFIFGKKMKDMRLCENICGLFYAENEADKKEIERMEKVFAASDVRRLNYRGIVFVLHKESRTLLACYMPVKDIRGHAAAYIRGEFDRKIANFGEYIGKSLTLTLILLGFFTFVFLDWNLNLFILKPVRAIEENVKIFKDRMENRVLAGFYGRNDELASLARSIDDLKQEILKRHEELKRLNAELEERVKERTAELEKKNRELLLSEMIFAHALEGIVVADEYRRIAKTNNYLGRMLGYEPWELWGQPVEILGFEREDDEDFSFIWLMVEEKGSWQGEICARDKEGRRMPFLASLFSLQNDDKANFIIMLANISELKEAEEKLERMAYYDTLTSLPNRAMFYEKLKQALESASCRQAMMAVLFMDVDRFKIVNDTLGHEMGDRLLVNIGKRLKNLVRSSDIVCRWGGDEFTLILEGIRDEREIAFIADKLIDGITKPFVIDSIQIRVGLSIGIAVYPKDDTTVEGLVRKADAALYEAKERGRGIYWFYSEELEDKYQDDLPVRKLE